MWCFALGVFLCFGFCFESQKGHNLSPFPYNLGLEFYSFTPVKFEDLHQRFCPCTTVKTVVQKC